LANAALRNNTFYNAKPVDPDKGKLLFMEVDILNWMETNNPANPTLQGVSNYVYSLEALFGSQAQTIINNSGLQKPVITGPTNQTVVQGTNATFSVSVVSSLPVFYQWFRNGVPILGANASSYTLTNAQLSDSGATFSVMATNAIGSTLSNTVTLTVTASLIAFAYAGSTDYSTELAGGTDNVPYQFNFPVVIGQNIIAQFPGIVNAEFVVIKYPAAWGNAAHYLNPPIDTGPIPGFAFQNGNIGLYNYAFSRNGNPFTINSSNALTLTT
jgi:hypothetical protein